MKKIFLFIILTIIFSFLIFGIKSYFFSGLEDERIKQIEEQYIDPVALSDDLSSGIINDIRNEIVKINTLKKNNLDEKLLNYYNSATQINIVYNPKNFNKECSEYTNTIGDFLKSEKIDNKIDVITVELNKDTYDVRGKMKNKTLKLFGVLKMEKNEFLSVSIHEFAHYVDLYFLEKKVLKDISDYFYEISWESTKVLKSGQKQIDFVSGYAMTNKYEDFAESFTYYVLHNKDFLEKSKKSLLLKAKYNFFTNSLFIKNEFKNYDFSENNKIKDYYRDITKIDYNLENFLQYIKNNI